MTPRCFAGAQLYESLKQRRSADSSSLNSSEDVSRAMEVSHSACLRVGVWVWVCGCRCVGVWVCIVYECASRRACDLIVYSVLVSLQMLSACHHDL